MVCPPGVRRPDTHVDALLSECISITRDTRPDLVRVFLYNLVLPYDDGLVERTWVGDDPRNERADVVQIGDEVPAFARAVNGPGQLLEGLRDRAAQGEREEDLHPPADVDDCVTDAELLEILANV